MRAAPSASGALVLGALALGLAGGCGDGGSEGNGGATPSTAALTTRDDPRLRGLVRDCPTPGVYDRNLAHPVPVLVQKLDAAIPDVMHRAKAELATIGAPALEEVARLFDTAFSDPMGGPRRQNAIDVIVRMDLPEAREVVLRALSHPSDSVRDMALGGLVNHHTGPEDYDLLHTHFEVELSPRLREAFAASLYAADPGRASAEYLDWVEAGLHREYWEQLLSSVLVQDDDELDARCVELWDQVDLAAQHFLAAAAARAGDPLAEAFLEAELASEEQHRRTRAVQAFGVIGEAERVAPSLGADPDPVVRSTAANVLAGRLGDPDRDDAEARAALRAALDDPEPELRTMCLGILCAVGDEVALERALAGLRGDVADLKQAIDALRGRLPFDEALAARALEALQLRWDGERELPWKQKLATLQAIGLVPQAEAAEWLLALAPEVRDEDVLGHTPLGWLAMQAANTGAPGREVLAGRLAAATEPMEQLDLVFALASAPSDTVRDALVAVVEDDEVDPYVRLYAADRLCRVGPSSVVAPILKRVALRIEQQEVRRSMACLLWLWY